MTRLGAVFWLVLVLAAGFTTFKVKYAVQDIEDQLNRVRRQTIAEQQEIRVLTAEWTYLNQPERLAELNRRFLGLASINAKQLQRSLEDIPLRPPAAVPDTAVEATPEPAAPPDTLVEASPGPPEPQTAATPLPIPAAALSPAASIPDAPAQPGQAETAQVASSLDALIAQTAALNPAALKSAASVQLAKAAPAPTTNSL